MNSQLEELKAEAGYLDIKEFPDGSYTCLVRQLFTFRITWSRTGNYFGYDYFWCYSDLAVARAAFEAWDGTGDPADGWVKSVTDRGEARREEPR